MVPNQPGYRAITLLVIPLKYPCDPCLNLWSKKTLHGANAFLWRKTLLGVSMESSAFGFFNTLDKKGQWQRDVHVLSTLATQARLLTKALCYLLSSLPFQIINGKKGTGEESGMPQWMPNQKRTLI
eukprot:94141-Pelagomonas_calceolata.AAC.2